VRQLSSSPSVAPSRDHTVYIVVEDYGPLGTAFRETDEAEADRRTLIDDLIAGQYQKPVRIVALNEARAVLDEALRRRTWLPSETRDFVVRETGEDIPSELVDE